MNLITVEKVSKQYSERILLDGANLLVNSGDRIGLIGRNGSGKTTLLRMLAGEEQADAGNVTIWGKVRVRFLSQNPHFEAGQTVLGALYESDSADMQLLQSYMAASVLAEQNPDDAKLQEALETVTWQMDAENGWSLEAKAKTILSKLGVSDFGAQVATLSGGQQKRVALARALLDPADVLILDEPTNHVDADAIAWLEDYLRKLPGALLMVTHDRYFLDRVVNKIVELDRRELVPYEGNYSKYLEKKTERDEQLARSEAKRRALLRQELAWLGRGAQARSTKQKARIQRVEALQAMGFSKADQKVAMALAGRRLGKRVLSAENLSKTFDGNSIFSGVDFTLQQGERIGIVGPNGAGKSTLLNVLAGKLTSESGSVDWGETVSLGYYDQQASNLEDETRVIDFILRDMPVIESDEGVRVEAAKMLEWFLFSRSEQQSRIGSLSGGERRRLYLLHVLMFRPNVLFLDEPTNDLDIQTLQVLEQFLDHYTGCLVVVSHDRYFLDRNVDFLFAFEEDAVGGRYPTPYANYLAAKDGRKEPKKAEKPEAKSQKPKAEKKGLSYKEQKELDGLSVKVEKLEAKKALLESKINEVSGDYVMLGKVSAEITKTEAELDGLMERWLELSESAEM